MPLHIGSGRSLARALKDTIDYFENPLKTDNGEWITSYECDAHTVEEEFLISKQKYLSITGRNQGKRDVIAYHIRQSFKPGEVTPEEANRIGYELAKRFTKGNFAFIVCTHTDCAHIHNHVLWNSTSLSSDRKFRNFLGSSFALRRVSDLICAENGLPVIKNPGSSKGKNYAKHMESLAVPNKIPTQKPNLLIDIQAKMHEGKGAGYERWAKLHNLKQMAQTLIYLQEQGLDDYDVLAEKSSAAVERFNELSGKLKQLDDELTSNANLQKQIVTYAKTRQTYINYRKADYSKKFKEQNETDIILHQAAKKYFDELNLKKLPTVKSLREDYAPTLEDKKKTYREYRTAKAEMKALVTTKANVDKLLNTTERTPKQGLEKRQR